MAEEKKKLVSHMIDTFTHGANGARYVATSLYWSRTDSTGLHTEIHTFIH